MCQVGSLGLTTQGSEWVRLQTAQPTCVRPALGRGGSSEPDQCHPRGPTGGWGPQTHVSISKKQVSGKKAQWTKGSGGTGGWPLLAATLAPSVPRVTDEVAALHGVSVAPAGSLALCTQVTSADGPTPGSALVSLS